MTAQEALEYGLIECDHGKLKRNEITESAEELIVLLLFFRRISSFLVVKAVQ